MPSHTTARLSVVAAAALALALPLTLQACGAQGSSDEAGTTPSASTPTPTGSTEPTTPDPTSTSRPRPPRGVLDVSDLATGAEPAISYVDRGVLHQPDGTTTKVDTRHRVSSFVELANGARVWQTAGKAGTAYVELQPAGAATGAPVRSAYGLGVNPGHTIVAWVMPSGQVMTWDGTRRAPAALGDPITAGQDLRIGAVTGDDCRLACSVVVNVSGGQRPRPWEASSNGTAPLRDGGYLVVNDISRSGLTIGYGRITDTGSCSKLLGGGEFQGFSTCRNALASFSPDGRLILADPAYHDGIGNGVIAVYGLDGHRLFQRHSTAQAQAFYPSAEWEDAGSVLAPVFQDGRWAVVRFGTHGAMEYAVEPVAGKDVRNPFVLPTGGVPAV